MNDNLRHTPEEIKEQIEKKWSAYCFEKISICSASNNCDHCAASWHKNLATKECLAKAEILEVLIRITIRLKKYHLEQKEPEVLELMDILDAENIIEKATGIDPGMKIEEVIK